MCAPVWPGAHVNEGVRGRPCQGADRNRAAGEGACCWPGCVCRGWNAREGRGTGARGSVWDVSIFYKTTTRINHRSRPWRGHNTGMWLLLLKRVGAIALGDIRCSGCSTVPSARDMVMVGPLLASAVPSAGEASPAVKILVIRPGWLSTASPQCELITPSSGPCDILSLTMFTLFLLC